MVDIKSNAVAADSFVDEAPAAVADRRGFTEEELRQAIELMFFAYRDMTAGPDEMLATMGLGRAHHRVIHFIGRNPGIPVAELLTLLRITKQSLARVLREAMNRHLVMQRQGADDRRQRQLYLTPRGSSLEASLSAVQQERIVRAFAGMPAAALDGWREVLWSMVEEGDRGRLQHAQERRRRFGEQPARPASERR